MAYIYVVTRIVEHTSDWNSYPPNLGVHTQKKLALSHFDSVISDRKKMSNVHIIQSNPRPSVGRMSLLSEARIEYEDIGSKVVETLRLERWEKIILN